MSHPTLRRSSSQPITCLILTDFCQTTMEENWIGLCSVLRPRQHSIGYMGDGFYRSKYPTNSIKVLKEKAVKENNTKNKENTKYTCMDTHKK